MRTTLLLSLCFSLAGVSTALANGHGRGHGDPAEHFKKLDSNGDGAVTADEVQDRSVERFGKMDANSDGKVTRDEARNGMRKHAKNRFAKKDIDGDGRLSRKEAERMPDRIFERMDQNGDGFLDKEELKNSPMAKRFKKHGSRRFDVVDSNNDSTITPDEAAAEAARRFDAMDSDDDGKVTLQELKDHRHHGKHQGKHHGKHHGKHQGKHHR